MGEAAPPMLEARAIPRMRALEKFESDGRLRRSGYGLTSNEQVIGQNLDHF